MISSLTGKVQSIEENVVELDVNGVGYELICTQSACEDLSTKNQATLVKVLTYMQVKEDAMVLFGFKSREEKSMFLKLISVSGIGPKMAISILSGVNPSDLAMAILSGNSASLSQIKGVGKKTAERIVLELKEKVQDVSLTDAKPLKDKKLSTEAEDAVFALTALGIKVTESRAFVEEIATEGMSTEEIIKKALKGISR